VGVYVTLEELQAQREKLLAALSQPEQVQFADRSLRNRRPEDIRAAIAQIDAEIAQLTATPRRQVLLSSEKGL
jgi:hypothetical protein